jgi:hypothetical protein
LGGLCSDEAPSSSDEDADDAPVVAPARRGRQARPCRGAVSLPPFEPLSPRAQPAAMPRAPRRKKAAAAPAAGADDDDDSLFGAPLSPAPV